MSFLSDASSAFDALAGNLLPFYTAQQNASSNASDNAAAAAIAEAQANANAAASVAKAKLYTSLAIGGVTAIVLLIMIKRRRA